MYGPRLGFGLVFGSVYFVVFVSGLVFDSVYFVMPGCRLCLFSLLIPGFAFVYAIEYAIGLLAIG